MKNEPKFKVGDKVNAWGIEGIVTKSDPPQFQYPIAVSLNAGWESECRFTSDGRHYEWHREPTLKLVERPKRKVKKEVTVWVNVARDGRISAYSGSTEGARSYGDCNDVAVAVPCVGHYEVEE